MHTYSEYEANPLKSNTKKEKRNIYSFLYIYNSQDDAIHIVISVALSHGAGGSAPAVAPTCVSDVA